MPCIRYVNIGNPSLQLRRGPSTVHNLLTRCYCSASTANASSTTASMKRSAPSPTKPGPKAKKPRPEVPEYHSTPSMKDETGDIIWPAPSAQIEGARKFIKEWYVILHDSCGHTFLTIILLWQCCGGQEDTHYPRQGCGWLDVRGYFAEDSSPTRPRSQSHFRPSSSKGQ